MTRHFLRRSSATLAALALTAAGLLPPEHAHGVDEGHERREIVHRHFDPHRPGPNSSIDHPDEDAPRYVDTVYLAVRSDASARPMREAATLASALESTPGLIVAERVVSSDIRTHDPPWRIPRLLRGPPTLLA